MYIYIYILCLSVSVSPNPEVLQKVLESAGATGLKASLARNIVLLLWSQNPDLSSVVYMWHRIPGLVHPGLGTEFKN